MLKILTEIISPHLPEMTKIEPLDPFGPVRALRLLRANFERDVKLGKSSVNQELQQAIQDTPKFLISRSKANEHFARVTQLISMGEAARVKILPSEIIVSETIDKIMRSSGTSPLMLQALRAVQDNPPSNLEDLQAIILREIPSHDGKTLHDSTNAEHEQETMDKLLLALSKQQSAFFAGKGKQKQPFAQRFDTQKSSRSPIHKDKRNPKYSGGNASRATSSAKFQIPNVPSHIWNSLSEDARKEFVETRKKLYKLSKGENTNDEQPNEVADLALNFDDLRIRRATALMARVEETQQEDESKNHMKVYRHETIQYPETKPIYKVATGEVIGHAQVLVKFRCGDSLCFKTSVILTDGRSREFDSEDRKSTRLNSSHSSVSRMPSSA